MRLPFASWLLPLESLSLHVLRAYLSLKSQIWKLRFREIKLPAQDDTVNNPHSSELKSSFAAD